MKCERTWIEPDEMNAKYKCEQDAKYVCIEENGAIKHLCTHHASKWRMWRRRKKQKFEQKELVRNNDN